MSRRFLIVVAAFLIFSLAAAIPARSAPSSQPAGAHPFGSLLSNMAAQLKFSKEQQEKVKVQIDALIVSTDEFRNAAIEKSSRAIAALPSETGDAAAKARQQVIDDQKKATADYRNLVFNGMTKVYAELTPAQRLHWETYELNRTLFSHYNNVDTTAAQRTQITQAIDATAADLAKATTLAASDQATGKVIKKILNEILPDEQVGLFVRGGPPPILFPTIPGSGGAPGTTTRAATRPVRDPNLP